MSTKELTIHYPAAWPDFLQETPAEFEQEARLAMAVKLFERKRLSSGQAAVLAGMDRVTFLLQLHQFGVPMIDLPAEELRADLENA
jgi:predicted HTH domain antitoxin